MANKERERRDRKREKRLEQEMRFLLPMDPSKAHYCTESEHITRLGNFVDRSGEFVFIN